MTETADFQETAIRRRADGSIDVDAYLRHSMMLRAMAFHDRGKGFSRRLARLIAGLFGRRAAPGVSRDSDDASVTEPILQWPRPAPISNVLEDRTWPGSKSTTF